LPSQKTIETPISFFLSTLVNILLSLKQVSLSVFEYFKQAKQGRVKGDRETGGGRLRLEDRLVSAL